MLVLIILELMVVMMSVVMSPLVDISDDFHNINIIMVLVMVIVDLTVIMVSVVVLLLVDISNNYNDVINS